MRNKELAYQRTNHHSTTPTTTTATQKHVTNNNKTVSKTSAACNGGYVTSTPAGGHNFKPRIVHKVKLSPDINTTTTSPLVPTDICAISHVDNEGADISTVTDADNSGSNSNVSVEARIPQPYRTSFSAVIAPRRSNSSVGRARSTSPFQRNANRLTLPNKVPNRSTTPNYRTTSQMVNSTASRVSSRNPSPATRHLTPRGSPVDVLPNNMVITGFTSSHNQSRSQRDSSGQPAGGRISRADQFRSSYRSAVNGNDALLENIASKTTSSSFGSSTAVGFSRDLTNASLPRNHQSTNSTQSPMSSPVSHLPQPVKSILVKRSPRSNEQCDTSNSQHTSNHIASPLPPPTDTNQSADSISCDIMPASGLLRTPSNGSHYSDPRIKKTIIQKDYIHCREFVTDRNSSMTHNGSQDTVKSCDEIDRTSKQQQTRHTHTLQRADTMPEGNTSKHNAIVDNTSTSPVYDGHIRKSLSNSISSFLRKMSPSLTRRSRRTQSVGRHKTSTSSASSSHTSIRQRSVDSVATANSYQDSEGVLTPDSSSYGSDVPHMIIPNNSLSYNHTDTDPLASEATSKNSGSRGRPKLRRPSPIKLIMNRLGRKSRDRASSGSSDKENGTARKRNQSADSRLSNTAISPTGTDTHPHTTTTTYAPADASPAQPSPPVLTDEGARILKSITHNHTQHATTATNMYHSFKEKQSPHISGATNGKRQAVKATSTSKPTNNGAVKACPPKTLNVQPHTTTGSVTTATSHAATRHQLDHSFESIGTCSLDPHTTTTTPLATIGSDPSLSNKSNGQPAQLHSPATTTQPAQRSNKYHHTTSSGGVKSPSGTLTPPVLPSPGSSDAATPLSQQRVPVDGSPATAMSSSATAAAAAYDETHTSSPVHTPSYLKLSCSLSGYSSYKAYASPISTPLGGPSSENSSSGSLDRSSNDHLNSYAGTTGPRKGVVLAKLNGKVSPAVVASPSPPATPPQPARGNNAQHASASGVVNGDAFSKVVHTARVSPAPPGTNKTSTLHHLLDRGECKVSQDYTSRSNPVHRLVNDEVDQSGVCREERIITNGPIRAFGADDVVSRTDSDSGVSAITTLTATTTATATVTVDEPKDRVLGAAGEDIPTIHTEIDTPPVKDGHAYLCIVEQETARLEALCDQVEQDLRETMPDDVSGKLRVTVGKAQLLINKKFEQFKGLCKKNINEDPSAQFYTTCEDLAGFWDMVDLQVTDVNNMFAEVDKMRKNNWTSMSPSPSQILNRSLSGSGAKPVSPRSKTRPGSGNLSSGKATPKSMRSVEAQKARQEARKRLMEMKRAGRQRKVSQGEQEQDNIVEIYT